MAHDPKVNQKGRRALFEGWPLIPIVPGATLVVVFLMVPAWVRPLHLPIPQVDRRLVQRAELELERLAREAETQGLGFDARALGDAVRRHGLSEAEADGDAALFAGEVEARARRAVSEASVTELRKLLAYQTSSFVRALRNFERTGSIDTDLKELGGSFLRHAEASGWVRPDRSVRASNAELSALFRARWLTLTRLEHVGELRLSLNDLRLYYGFLLRYPPSRSEANFARLRFVEALGKKDYAYPAHLARGILLVQVGDAEGANRSFRSHLTQHPTGAWHFWARNLLFTTSQAAEPTWPAAR